MDLDVDELNRATDAVRAVDREVRYLSSIVPINAATERERFLSAWAAGDPVNPRFEYAPADDLVLRRVAEARDRLPAAPYWRDLLGHELDLAVRACRSLLSRDPGEMTAYSLDQFGPLTPASVQQATAYLAANPSPSGSSAKDWSSARAAEVMRAVLAALGLLEWTVETPENMAARMSVSSVSSSVRIRQGTTFTTAELRRLVVHELGTHALRTENSRRQPLNILGYALSGNVATEEGLAVWHEQQAGLSDTTVMRRYALRVLACDVAQTADFRAVFARLLAHTSVEEAYELAMRVKRGLVDTAEPGGYLKDHVYFSGSIDVSRHLGQHPADRDLLLATKWPLSQVTCLRELAADGLLYRPWLSFDAVRAAARSIHLDGPPSGRTER